TNGLVPAGSPVPFAPDLTATAGIQYELLFGSWSVIPRLQLSYVGAQLSTPFRYTATRVPSRTVSDLRVMVMPSEDVRPEPIANNLFDKSYVAAQVQTASSADGGSISGAPRLFGLRVKVDF